MTNCNVILKLKSYDLNLLNFFIRQLQQQIVGQKCQPISILSHACHTRKYTVLRSPHVHKKSREQFQLVVHAKDVGFHLNHEKLITFFNLVKKNDFSQPFFLTELSTVQAIGVKMKIVNEAFLV